MIPPDRTNHGLAALSINGHRDYDVDVLTGEAQETGSFPKNHQVADWFLSLNQR
ncbi:hypothetical protein [Streptomyces microflavus]|uniref:hypothetical protein n=1 Tax=Streptomyces microflavus TaxID=1919 RepID=UPI0033B4893F